MAKITINIGGQRVNPILSDTGSLIKVFTPGEIVAEHTGHMRGHGTYPEDDYLKASLAGVVEKVNRLVSIKPFKSRYNGEVGDVVVGRITELQQKKWKVNTNSRLDSVLSLSSVNLPGGEVRRRMTEDEQTMRRYLVEGDLISAEVMNVLSDGSLSLHTRNLSYGKLGQGVLVKVYPSLIKKSKTHFHNVTPTTGIILGKNGCIWIYPKVNATQDGGYTQNLEENICQTDRECMARIRNCILALAASKISIYYSSVIYAYECSKKYQVQDLLHPEHMFDVVLMTQNRLHLSED